MKLLNWLSRHDARRAKKAQQYARMAETCAAESTRNFEWARNYHSSHPNKKVFIDSGNRNLKLARIYKELARRYAKPRGAR